MRKQCRRKIWNKVNPIEYAITGAAITAEDKLDKVRFGELSAIESMVKGNGTALSAGVPATDYVAPGAITTSGLTQSTNRLLVPLVKGIA